MLLYLNYNDVLHIENRKEVSEIGSTSYIEYKNISAIQLTTAVQQSQSKLKIKNTGKFHRNDNETTYSDKHYNPVNT